LSILKQGLLESSPSQPKFTSSRPSPQEHSKQAIKSAAGEFPVSLLGLNSHSVLCKPPS